MKKLAQFLVMFFAMVIFSNNTILNPNLSINYQQQDIEPIPLKSIITNNYLGEIGRGEDIQPTEDEIKAAIKEKNETVNIEAITVLDSFKKGALIEGDNKIYSGSVYVAFRTKNFVKIEIWNFNNKINDFIINPKNKYLYFINDGKVYLSKDDFLFAHSILTNDDYNVSSLTCDNNGTIFAANIYGQIFKCLINEEKFTFIAKIKPMVKVMTTDNDGNLYAGTWDGVYKRVNNQENIFTKMQGIDDQILALTCDNNKNIYALNEEATSIFSNKRNIYKSLANSGIFKSNPMLGASNSITTLITYTNTNTNIFDDQIIIKEAKGIIKSLKVTSDGSIFVLTTNELFNFILLKGKIFYLPTSD